MSRTLQASPLEAKSFAPYGDILSASGTPDKIINQGKCGRFHDRAELDFGTGRAGISLFQAEPRRLPFSLELMERHPLGSQAFVPMHQNPFLVVVAPDDNGKPGQPLAFVTQAGQGVNFYRNIWHAVLCPLSAPGLFAVIDRIGQGDNLEEHWFPEPWVIE